jgi:hypothetical protein
MLLAFFFLIDRLYQFKRFGEWTSTYLDMLAKAQKASDSSTPPDWPWTLSPVEGISNVLFSPEKSIFLYDPLIIILLLIVCIRHFKLKGNAKFKTRGAYLIAGSVSLIIYLLEYARYYDWGGDSAWGARFHTSPVHILCLLAAPLYLEVFTRLWWGFKGLFVFLLGASLVVQFMSIFFGYGIEITQQVCGIGTSFRLLQRFENFWAFITRSEIATFPASCYTDYYSDKLVTPYFWSFINYTDKLLPLDWRLVTNLIWLFIGGRAAFGLIKLVIMVKKNEQILNPIPDAF